MALVCLTPGLRPATMALLVSDTRLRQEEEQRMQWEEEEAAKWRQQYGAWGGEQEGYPSGYDEMSVGGYNKMGASVDGSVGGGGVQGQDWSGSAGQPQMGGGAYGSYSQGYMGGGVLGGAVGTGDEMGGGPGVAGQWQHQMMQAPGRGSPGMAGQPGQQEGMMPQGGRGARGGQRRASASCGRGGGQRTSTGVLVQEDMIRGDGSGMLPPGANSVAGQRRASAGSMGGKAAGGGAPVRQSGMSHEMQAHHVATQERSRGVETMHPPTRGMAGRGGAPLGQSQIQYSAYPGGDADVVAHAAQRKAMQGQMPEGRHRPVGMVDPYA